MCVSAYVVGKKLENYLLLLALARRLPITRRDREEGRKVYFLFFHSSLRGVSERKVFFAKKLKCNTLLNAHTVACSVRVRVLM